MNLCPAKFGGFRCDREGREKLKKGGDPSRSRESPPHP
jgi:hypothetical protein